MVLIIKSNVYAILLPLLANLVSESVSTNSFMWNNSRILGK